jgi:hypothetical protein
MYPAWRVLCRRTWHGLQATPSAQQVVPVSGASIGRRCRFYPAWRVLCRRTVARSSSNALSTTSCACFGRFHWSAVMLLSSAARSMPPHRGAAFKQRPQYNKLCLFRALPLAGGAASIQSGAFFAAAPWRGLQATPQAQQKVVPVSGAVLGGVVEMSRKKIPAAKTYALGLGQSPSGWRDGKGPVFVRSSKRPPFSPIPPANPPPSAPEKGADRLETNGLKRPRENPALIP